MGLTLGSCNKSPRGVSKPVADAYDYARRRGDRLSKCSWRDGEDIAQSYMVRVLDRGLQDMSVQFLMTDARLQSAAMSRLKGFDGMGGVLHEDITSNDVPPDPMMIETARKIAAGVSEKYERLFHCIYMMDMSNDETASEMGASKSWVDKASIKLKKILIDGMT